MVENEILESTKEFLGISKDVDSFDKEILIHINSSLMKIHQVGFGVPEIKMATNSKWNDVVRTDTKKDIQALPMVSLVVGLETKLAFDPPAPTTMEYMQKQVDDLLYRINLTCDDGKENG